LVARPTAFIKVTGRAAVEGARDFRGLVEQLQRDGISQFCLDLSDCLLMDSTFSGVLAHLASALGPKADGECPGIVLSRPNDRILDLLDSLGVLAVVGVLEEMSQQPIGGMTEVEVGSSSKRQVAECCLEAHRLLMALKPENVAKFQELTLTLERQLQSPPSP
jgi:anti-anti-sigma regulatory factor